MLIYCLVKPGCPRQDQSRGSQECLGIAAICRELRVWKGISDTHPQFTSLLARFVRCSPLVSRKQAVSSKFQRFIVDPGEKGVDGDTT